MASSGIGFLSKLFKEEMAATAQEISNMNIETVLHMPDPSLDWITGGFSLNRINLLFGGAGSGKSAIAAIAAGEAQKKRPGSVVLINDTEFYYHNQPGHIQRLTKYGVDVENCMIISGNTVDEAFSKIGKIEEALASKQLDVSAWIIDSWQGIENESAAKKLDENKDGTGASDSGNSHRGNAKTMNPVLVRLMKLAAKYNITVFIVQHCMVNQEQYGPRYLLLGGEKLKYLCDSIVYLETVNAKDSRLTDGDEVAAREDLIIGKKIRARADKTRNTVEGKSVEFWMNFEECHFAMANESLFTLATKLGVIYTQTEIITDPKGRPELDKDGNTKTKEKKGWLEVMVDDTPFSCYGQSKMVEKLKDPAFAAKVRAMCNDSKKMSATSGKFSEVKDT